MKLRRKLKDDLKIFTRVIVGVRTLLLFIKVLYSIHDYWEEVFRRKRKEKLKAKRIRMRLDIGKEQLKKRVRVIGNEKANEGENKFSSLGKEMEEGRRNIGSGGHTIRARKEGKGKYIEGNFRPTDDREQEGQSSEKIKKKDEDHKRRNEIVTQEANKGDAITVMKKE